MNINNIAAKIVFILLWAGSKAYAGDNLQAVLSQLRLPEGFSLSIFADNVPGARSLALGENGVVYVGTAQAGALYAAQDANGDGVAEAVHVIAKNLYLPNGVAYKNGALYVATVNRILRYDAISENLTHPPKPVVIYDQFPSDKAHGWKYLRFGPDGKLYTAVGAPCNVCDSKQEIYASLVRLDADGQNVQILARGIRNTVGFDWQPGTGALFFNDNGRDHLGDDAPPDELNLWSAKGEHFGYPYCHGGDILDPELANEKKCSQFKPPVWRYKAHVAPLGMRFYQGLQFPPTYQNQLLVAQHGSWNRTEPQGYKVVLITFGEDGLPKSEENFISGWLTPQGEVLGRPVDILTLPDGSVLVSDDQLGVIYRVTHSAKTRAISPTIAPQSPQPEGVPL